MPPIPSSLSDEFDAAVAALTRHKSLLSTYTIPQLRDCKGPLILQQQFASEVRHDIDAFARRVEALEGMAEDLERERDRIEARRKVDEWAEVLASLKKEARFALLSSKRNLDALARSYRDELLQSSVIREKTATNPTDDALMNASNDVTEALRRTTQLMQAELERSVLSTQMLGQSTANLRSASSAHSTLDSLLTSSKHLITALEKSDWIDRMLILAALGFFLLVCGYIIKQRIFDRGLRFMMWWTRFLPDFAGDDEFVRLEKGEMTTALSTAATSLTTALTTATASISFHSAVPTVSLVRSEGDDLTISPVAKSEYSTAPDEVNSSEVPGLSTGDSTTDSRTNQRDEL